MMKVIVVIKSVYGRDLIYPVNEIAVKFAQLIGKKTLEKKHLEVIQSLGFQIEQLNPYDLNLK